MNASLSYCGKPISEKDRKRFLEQLQRLPLESASLRTAFSNATDRHWYWVLTEGRRRSPALAEKLPKLPSDETQAQYTGLFGDAGFEQAVRAAGWIRQKAHERGLSTGAPTGSLLDFGCGWGRLTQVFLRDFEAKNITACDVSPEALELFRETTLPCRLLEVGARPPIELPDNSIDLVTAYSVFSHLSEEVHWAWVKELHRVLRPGGVMAVTTRPREFIDHVVALRRQTEIPDFARGAASSFLDFEAAYRKYDSGEFCFDVMGGGGDGREGFYGEALIPKAYVERVWGAVFHSTDFVSHLEHQSFDQNLLVARK